MSDESLIQGEAPAQPAEVEAVAVTQDESPTPPDTEAQAEPKKDVPPVQKRIDQLTWRAHETERRLNAELMRRQEAEQRAQQLERQLQDLYRQATMPTLDQVNHDPDAYAKAVQAHNEKWLQQQREAQQAAEHAAREQYARAQFEQTLQARVAEGQQKYPDYEDVVGNPSLPPLQSVNPALLAAIIEHEQMPDITYFLGKNPAEAHRIARLQPAKAILEVGKLAERLALKQPPPSKAPPPPSQVSGGTATVRRSLDSVADLDEWMALRQKQVRR